MNLLVQLDGATGYRSVFDLNVRLVGRNGVSLGTPLPLSGLVDWKLASAMYNPALQGFEWVETPVTFEYRRKP